HAALPISGRGPPGGRRPCGRDGLLQLPSRRLAPRRCAHLRAPGPRAREAPRRRAGGSPARRRAAQGRALPPPGRRPRATVARDGGEADAVARRRRPMSAASTALPMDTSASPAPARVALVTGAARGIGLAVARRFLRE